MAATHGITALHPSQSLRLKPEHREALLGYEDISGVSAQKLLDEALEDFVQIILTARAESLLKRAKKQQRSDTRAERKREVDTCLAQMEQQFSA